ncbi:ABC transporter permease subunit [Ornithinicoccus hortensis]|uniref:ABC-2 type transport system permease protein n=1 Tax=Ornithinicoccus hortensis TaxID=82346 RepID=A0A542YPF9_9MICO|nr:ABC transporter permease subunit [Ornithinicoccus hortensis]TQL49990.1 ABC-2 type transport system permease protein [Ornithinicoccus hortensis]
MNPTIARLSLQALYGQRRGIVLAVLPGVLVLLALVVTVLTDGALAFGAVVEVLGFGLILPLIALLVTTSVLGPEIDDGSIVFLLSKPVSRFVVAISKFLVAVLVTVVLGAGSLLVAGLLLDPGEPGRAVGVAVGGAVAGAAYCAVFVMLSALNRHGMVTGLIYILIFESALAPLLTGLRYVSVGMFGRRIAEAFDGDLTATGMGLTYAVVASVVVVVGGVFLSGQRLRSFQLRGDE